MFVDCCPNRADLSVPWPTNSLRSLGTEIVEMPVDTLFLWHNVLFVPYACVNEHLPLSGSFLLGKCTIFYGCIQRIFRRLFTFFAIDVDRVRSLTGFGPRRLLAYCETRVARHLFCRSQLVGAICLLMQLCITSFVDRVWWVQIFADAVQRMLASCALRRPAMQRRPAYAAPCPC